MVFKIQHNVNTKMHVLDEEHNLLCGSKGMFNYPGDDLKIENGKFFAVVRMPAVSVFTGSTYDMEIKDFMVEQGYCKVCIRKATKLAEAETK